MDSLLHHMLSCLEGPVALAATLKTLSSTRFQYIVERYSSASFLARIVDTSITNLVNGTAIGSSPWQALTKACSELMERIPSDHPSHDALSGKTYGSAASTCRPLAENRSLRELYERDALVNFWVSRQYLSDISADRDWKNTVASFGLTLIPKVFLVPSHKYAVAVSLLTAVDRFNETRLYAIGASCQKDSLLAGQASLNEAIMLALNQNLLSWACPKFSRLDLTRLPNPTQKHHFEPIIESATIKKGMFWICRKSSPHLSGISHEKAKISHESFTRLLGYTPQANFVDIPCFTEY